MADEPTIPGPLSMMPEELLVAVMRLLPVQQVFPLMSMSKRWETAARSVVRTHPAIIVTSKPQKESASDRMDVILAKAGTDMPSLMASLSHTRNLRVFKYLSERRSRGIFQIVCNNSQSLVTLHIIRSCLPVMHVSDMSDMRDGDGGGGNSDNNDNKNRLITYPNLRELQCRHLLSPVAAVCQALEKLTIKHQKTIGVLSALNADTLQSFAASITDWGRDKCLGQLVQGLARFTNLRVLKLDLSSLKQDEEDGKVMMRLFEPFKHLQEVDVRMVNKHTILDTAVVNMAKNNPALTILALRGARLMAACLTGLASCENMVRLILHTCHHFDMDGLLAVLRGRSRDRLRYCYIRTIENMERMTLESELRAMAWDNTTQLRIKTLTWSVAEFSFV